MPLKPPASGHTATGVGGNIGGEGAAVISAAVTAAAGIRGILRDEAIDERGLIGTTARGGGVADESTIEQSVRS